MTDADSGRDGNSGPRDSQTQFVRELFANAGRRYDAVVLSGTLGMDALWKRRIYDAIPENREYRRILDLACGTGIVTSGLARRYPDAETVGLDVSSDMLAVARDRIENDAVEFVEKPAAAMTDLGRDSFDLVTASYLPKYTDLELLAANTETVLRDSGVAIFHDFTYPRTWPYPPIFDAYWNLLGRIVARVPGYDAISAELYDLIVDAVGWPEELQASLRHAGFDRVSVRMQPLEIAAIVTALNEEDS